jgi:hypothetical protein
MWAWRFAKLQHTAETRGWTRFVSMQDQYNLLQRDEEREMFGRPLWLDSDKVGVWFKTFLLCYVRGPEGLIVELAERLDGAGPSRTATP